MKKNTLKKLAFLCLALLPMIAACESPRAQTQIGGETAFVKVLNAPKTAEVFIDDIRVGTVSTNPSATSNKKSKRNRAGYHSTPYLFPVRPGVHRVRVTNGDSVLIDQEFYSGSDGITSITVPGQ